MDPILPPRKENSQSNVKPGGTNGLDLFIKKTEGSKVRITRSFSSLFQLTRFFRKKMKKFCLPRADNRTYHRSHLHTCSDGSSPVLGREYASARHIWRRDWILGCSAMRSQLLPIPSLRLLATDGHIGGVSARPPLRTPLLDNLFINFDDYSTTSKTSVSICHRSVPSKPVL